jgi:hypothetical protein
MTRRGGNPSEEVATAYYQADLDAGAGDLGNFLSERGDLIGIDSERFISREYLATQLQ